MIDVELNRVDGSDRSSVVGGGGGGYVGFGALHPKKKRGCVGTVAHTVGGKFLLQIVLFLRR